MHQPPFRETAAVCRRPPSRRADWSGRKLTILSGILAKKNTRYYNFVESRLLGPLKSDASGSDWIQGVVTHAAKSKWELQRSTTKGDIKDMEKLLVNKLFLSCGYAQYNARDRQANPITDLAARNKLPQST